MENALVIGASGGIGAAVCKTLEGRGVQVSTVSRQADGLDVTDETSVKSHLERFDTQFDLVFVATGVLAAEGATPEKAIREVTASSLLHQFAVNAVGPLLLLKHSLRLLPKDRHSVFAALSARVGSIGDNGIGGWHSYRTSKTALNQLIHGAAIEMRRTHKQAIAVCLHPGTVATPFTANYAGRHKTVPASEAATNLLSVIDSLTIDQSGGFFDFAGKSIVW
ncbi:MAG: SDR family NAD(P)-dependent oxidoreductase [Pseudomonadota bacterium]